MSEEAAQQSYSTGALRSDAELSGYAALPLPPLAGRAAPPARARAFAPEQAYGALPSVGVPRPSTPDEDDDDDADAQVEGASYTTRGYALAPDGQLQRTAPRSQYGCVTIAIATNDVPLCYLSLPTTFLCYR